MSLRHAILTALAVFSATWAVTAHAAVPLSNTEAGVGQRLSAEILEALEKIETQASGYVLVVDCNATFGYETIQGAIDDAEDGDTVVVLPRNAFGLECNGDAYVENINFLGKSITVQNLMPTHTDYVKTTVIDGSGVNSEDAEGSVVVFNHGETPETVLAGFTLTGGIGTIDDSNPNNLRYGGGVYCEESSPTIQHCVVTENSEGPYGGGGIAGKSSSAVISHCMISSNVALAGGGGVYFFQGASTPIIENSTIMDNVALGDDAGYSGWGGGIALSGSHAEVANCVIANNMANRGGGVHCQLSNAFFTHSSIVDNVAAQYGGGLSTWSSGFAANPTLANSIVWGNVAPPESGIAIAAGGPQNTLTVEFSNVEGGVEEVMLFEGAALEWLDGNIESDPMFEDPVNEDYHLTPDSPARNAGDPDFIPADNEADMDGNPRVLEGRVDIGADELLMP